MMRVFVLVGLLTLALGTALPAWAFECPIHFQKAEAAIAKATQAMKAMPRGGRMALVHSLIDDAKMLLEGAKHNHEHPQGGYDHARAIAKAEAARGYAEAAEIFAKQK